MKELLAIMVLGLLLSGCGSGGSLSMFKKEILIKDDYPRNELKNIIDNSARSEDGFRFKEILYYTNEEGGFGIVRPKDFDKDSVHLQAQFSSEVTVKIQFRGLTSANFLSSIRSSPELSSSTTSRPVFGT